MPGAENIQLDEHAQEQLQSLARSRTCAVRRAERARIIVELAAGRAKQEIAKQYVNAGTCEFLLAGNGDFYDWEWTG